MLSNSADRCVRSVSKEPVVSALGRAGGGSTEALDLS